MKMSLGVMKKYMKIEKSEKSLNMLQKVKNRFKYVKFLLYLLIEIQQVTIYTKDRQKIRTTQKYGYKKVKK